MECLEIHPPKPLLDWLPETLADDELAPKKSVVRCLHCRNYLTELQYLIAVDGETTHVFRNPVGQAFEIQTYGFVEGCTVSGKPTEFFSWFPGHAWQYSYCRQCDTHLGWYYSCDGCSGFFGLITDLLILE